MDIWNLEQALKKCFPYYKTWNRRQSDHDDRMTKAIYDIRQFSVLQKYLQNLDSELSIYAINRWYNFWSAQWIEYIFSKHKKVQAHQDKYHKEIDFFIDMIPFDHKTTVFPKKFPKSYEYAKNNKREFILWLYDNQSQQGRKHLKNRLFICVYSRNNLEHWKLKAEMWYIEKKIDIFLHTFKIHNLEKFNFSNQQVFSDVIWVEK